MASKDLDERDLALIRQTAEEVIRIHEERCPLRKLTNDLKEEVFGENGVPNSGLKARMSTAEWNIKLVLWPMAIIVTGFLLAVSPLLWHSLARAEVHQSTATTQP